MDVIESDFSGMSDSALWAIANPIMDNLMAASTEINHAKHTQDFTPRMRDIVTPDHLTEVCLQYQQEKGLFTLREAVAVFKRPDSAAFVWKQAFSKAKGEFVAEMVLVHQNGRYWVDHVMVF
ncbi:hypothetical protein [Photobacterium sanguinicancri]|uniref:hypothetical protein n=1 Tax=Photobacterium sanguinicancri TaxID=875932 RepID=UPI003D10225A